MDALGLRLVKSLVVHKDMSVLATHGVGESDLFDDGLSALKCTRKYITDTGDWPTVKIVSEKAGVDLPDDTDPLEYITNIIRKRTLGKRLDKDLIRAAELLESRDPDEALRIVREAGLKHKVKGAASIISHRESGEARLELYKEVLELGGFKGIETPWKQLNNAVQGWVDGFLSVIIAMTNTGKAQPLSTKVMTPKGWVKIGDCRVGDLVVSIDGLPTTVTGVFPQGKKEVVKVTFSDRTSVKCCEDHLWKVTDQTGKEHVKTAKDLAHRLEWTQSMRWYIPMTEVVQFDGATQPLHPYLMGVLLGDGGMSGHGVNITSEDSDILDESNRRLPVGTLMKQRKNKGLTYDIIADDRNNTNKVINALRYLGLWGKTSHTKFIPECYKICSKQQRLEVLRGLLDTDGSVDERGSIEYSSVSRKLIDDVQFIVESLGGTGTIAVKKTSWTHKGITKESHTFRCIIKMPRGMNPFKLERKKDRYAEALKFREPHRRIKKIEYVVEEECVCISVGHPSSLYLTEHCIVTHNSWLLCIIANHCLELEKKVLFVTLEMSSPRMQKRIDSIRYQIPFKMIRNAEMEEEEYQYLLEEDEGGGDILFADKTMVQRVSDVTALVLEHKPDIVLIDGGYRFKGSGGSSWEATRSVVEELQLTAESTDIPWVVTTQAGDSSETGKEKKRGPKMRLWNARYGKEWVIDPDVVIGLYQDEDLRLIKSSEIYTLKMRDAVEEDFRRNHFRIKWDMTKMEFDEHDYVGMKEEDHEVSY